MAPQQMTRSAPSFEVETLTLSTSDPASLAAWAELGAQGFHVVSASAITGADGKQVLLLERVGTPGKDLRLPAAVEQVTPLAGAVRGKLQAIVAERLQANRPPAAGPGEPPAAAPSKP